MIAVIVLMLLLLLVGLWGFKNASLSARINTLNKDIATAVAQRRYHIAQSGTQKPHTLSGKVGSTEMTVENIVSAERQGEFVVILKNQSKEICEELKKFNIFHVKNFKINGTEDHPCVTSNEMELYFSGSSNDDGGNGGGNGGGDGPLDGACDRVPFTYQCEGEPQYDAEGCLRTKVFECPEGTQCVNKTLCCEKDEEEPACYTQKAYVDSATPGCPKYLHYSGECACPEGFTFKECRDGYKKSEEQTLPTGESCHKCVLKTCAEYFGAEWSETAPSCRIGQTLETKKLINETACYQCTGAAKCPLCQTPEISSPTGCMNNDNEDIGECAHCQNGTVVMDQESCQKCVLNTASKKYVWQNESDGSNKQSDGKCCIGGALKYDNEKCPQPKIDEPNPDPDPDVCEVPLYGQKYNAKNDLQTEENQTGCCTLKKLTRIVGGNMISFKGWKKGESSPQYGCCKDGFETIGQSCCPADRTTDDNKKCCATSEKATKQGCCPTKQVTVDEKGEKQCCDKVVCGTSCCSYCDESGEQCGDCEAPLYTKAYNKTTRSQTQVAGCCTNDRLIAGSVNAEFKGYKFGSGKVSYCCPEGFEILGDKTKTSSKCCAPEKVYTDAKGVKQCCDQNRVPAGQTCCLESRKYIDSNGAEKCCSTNLVTSSEGRLVCQDDVKQCRPLTIKTERIGYSKKVKMCYLNRDQTKWDGCNDPEENDIYRIYADDTITVLNDTQLKFQILGIFDTSDSNFWGNAPSGFVQRIFVKEVGGPTLVNVSGLNNFENCNKMGYVLYKYPNSKGKYKHKGQLKTKAFEETITLKAGKTYQIDIDIRNFCEACIVDTKCSVY